MPACAGMTEKRAALTTIESKIRTARELFGTYADVWLLDSRIRALVGELRTQLDASRRAMSEAGIPTLCVRCETEEGGSCCGAGIEDRYGVPLLAVNQLLGCTLPDRRTGEENCYFLGAQGCRLAARHVLCVNYLCRKIQRRLPREALVRVQNVTGAELETAFRLEETLRQSMRPA
ncbi:MAG: hypothetical protein AB1640_10790 [bacterium]